MSALRRFLASCVLLVGGTLAHAAGPRAALLTVLDGDARVLRDDGEYAAAEGLALEAGDILVTGPRTRLLRLETPDGTAVALGPDTQALVEPRVAGEAPAAVYLLAGWVKLNAPPGRPAAVAAPPLAMTSDGGSAVLAWTGAGGAMVFAESGTLRLQARGAANAPAALAAGQMLALAGGGARPELAARPTPAFVQAMPRAFMDSLPARASAFQGKDVAPRRLGPLAYADAQPWLDAEPALRKAFVRRWRGLARDPEFRRGLVAGLKRHPEWAPVLDPPAPARRASGAS